MSELIVESDELLKHVTGSIIDETETEVNAGHLLLILMLSMFHDTKGCPKCRLLDFAMVKHKSLYF